MPPLLAGKSAIVTGAASPRGLGLASAKLLAEHGARVLITDLDAAAAEAAARALQRHRQGRRRGCRGVFGGSHYSAAKAAVLGYTKAAARELGPDNIRVNAICPSFIDTDISAGLLIPERLDAILQGVPMGRVRQAHEVAGCVVFLASELASYVTGSEIDINGGSHLH